MAASGGRLTVAAGAADGMLPIKSESPKETHNVLFIVVEEFRTFYFIRRPVSKSLINS
jgi:hypothetical protein